MASGIISAFNADSTATVAASTSSIAVALDGSGPSMLVYNDTNAIAFLRLGATTSLTATNADLPIPAGNQILLSIGAAVAAAAVILDSGSGRVFLSRGSGSVY